MPTAQHDLAFSDDSRQWVVTGYALAFGSLLLLGGRLCDFYGRKRLFVIGMLGFAAASALGGAADGFTLLLIARIAQGAFAAVLAPAALSMVSVTFADDADERGRAFGVFGAISGAGGALGLLLGGVLTQNLSWRWCLYVNVVITAIAIAGALVFLVDRARPNAPSSTSRAPSWPCSACSASCTDSATPPPSAGPTRGRSARPGSVCCSWSRSSWSSGGSGIRCCRCGWCWTATGARPT
ncbi:MFS transporter [Amycolatopsis sp. NPDC058278]|uniref:MFS transporter n=1 Tax=Amycolatopsis sp. NPDC058278 TaxID=3346417 RepID=UPI0036D763EB